MNDRHLERRVDNAKVDFVDIIDELISSIEILEYDLNEKQERVDELENEVEALKNEIEDLRCED